MRVEARLLLFGDVSAHLTEISVKPDYFRLFFIHLSIFDLCYWAGQGSISDYIQISKLVSVLPVEESPSTWWKPTKAQEELKRTAKTKEKMS